MLVRLDHGVLIAVGCGERDEAASQAERAGYHVHRYGKGAAGADGRAAATAARVVRVRRTGAGARLLPWRADALSTRRESDALHYLQVRATPALLDCIQDVQPRGCGG